MIQLRLALAAAAIAALAGGIWWLRHDAARQREAELTAATYQDRILRMREAQERRDAANRLDDDGLLDALGRWIVPDAGP